MGDLIEPRNHASLVVLLVVYIIIATVSLAVGPFNIVGQMNRVKRNLVDEAFAGGYLDRYTNPI